MSNLKVEPGESAGDAPVPMAQVKTTTVRMMTLDPGAHPWECPYRRV